MKCCCCGCSNSKEKPVTKGTDPYQSEINGDETEMWECEDCRDDSALDI